MADGILLYGPLGDNGVVPTDLDQCRGHTDTTYPYYHYHTTYNLTAPVRAQAHRCLSHSSGLPSVTNHYSMSVACLAQYTVYCLMGCISPGWSIDSIVKYSASCTANTSLASAAANFGSMVVPW
jgi:hypothetical protein